MEQGIKKRVIYEIRRLLQTIDESYKYNGMFDYEQEMVKGAGKSADAIITISEALKKLIVSWGIDSDKVTVIPNAVNTLEFKPQQKSINLMQKYNLENRTVIGFIGSITAYEGLEYLITAVDDLIANNYNLSLLIVGDGREKKRFEKLAKSKYIIFTGRVPHSEVKEYYSIFDMCIYPRNNDEVCRYVPPLKLLEAMAMKKAVIVSDVAPLLEMVDDKYNGLICKSNNKDTIKLLYYDSILRDELAINGYNWVRKYRDWDFIIKQYIELYNSFKLKKG